MKPQAHQFVPGMNVGDAVTTHALEIQEMLRGMGFESEIYSVMKHVSPHMKGACRDYREHAVRSSGDSGPAIYHFSIGSELTGYFNRLPGKKIMIYHNITPEKYYEGISPEKAAAVREGRRQLLELAAVPDLALGVSEFNRRELEAAGFRRTGVLPLVADTAKWDLPPQKRLLRQYRDGKQNILFVGRMAPNKKIEDLLAFFYYYQKIARPLSRLLLVGPFNGMEKYHACLKALALEMDLRDVVFTGHVSDADLKSYYRAADLFVCLSEHEGFCMPLLEAMHFGVPVMAYAAAAIAETLGGAGVLVKEKNYPAMAELAAKIVSDKKLAARIASRQKERLADFGPENAKRRLKEHLKSLAVAGVS